MLQPTGYYQLISLFGGRLHTGRECRTQYRVHLSDYPVRVISYLDYLIRYNITFI